MGDEEERKARWKGRGGLLRVDKLRISSCGTSYEWTVKLWLAFEIGL